MIPIHIVGLNNTYAYDKDNHVRDEDAINNGIYRNVIEVSTEARSCEIIYAKDAVRARLAFVPSAKYMSKLCTMGGLVEAEFTEAFVISKADVE
jgi:hypothetical protein